jgi:hypothetical protein
MSMIKKNLDLIIVGFVALCVVMYDVTIDFFFGFLHFLFELLHIAYEWFELGIEHTVEHLFHTTRHGSQIVTFYILMLIFGGLMYWMWRVLPKFYETSKEFMLQSWTSRKTELELYWMSLTPTSKVKLVATALGVAYMASFFVM